MEKTKTNTIFKLFGSFAFLILANLFSNNAYAEHSISVSTSGSQDINVLATTGVAISEAKVDVATTCRAGYNLTLSTTVDDNNLYLNGDESYRDNHLYFSPSNGTSSLSESDNTWGYYLPSSSTDIPTSSSIFNAVPTTGQIVSLRTPAQTSRDTDINDSISIFYGVKASGSLVAGTYTLKDDTDHNTGSLIYYATLPEDCFKYTVEYNPTGTNTGIAVTGTGTVENQTIAEGITDNLTTDVYGNPTIDGITYYFTGWNTAQDGSGIQYSSGQSVTDLATAGTTITLYAQWTSCPSSHICYYKNNSSAEGEMAHQEATDNTEIMLFASNYSLTNHGFAGWSEDKNAATKLKNHETVVIYGPNETITTGTLSPTGLQLYAVWLESGGILQEWNSCEEMEIGDVIALRDARDDNAYSVAKLDDGRCWMIENLRLESENSSGEKALLAQGYNTSFSGLANAETSNFSDSVMSNSLYSTNGTTKNTVSGNYIGSRFPRYNNNNTLSTGNNPTNGNNNLYGYGNYYTWVAAVADTTPSFDINAVVYTTSICPTGWRIPKGGNKDIEAENDYWSLIVEGINNGVKPNNYSSFGRPFYYGNSEGSLISKALRSFPNNMIQSGYYSGDSASSQGTIGGYWTSVASVNNGAYTLNLESNRVDPGTSFSPKYYGHSIRCLFNNGE